MGIDLPPVSSTDIQTELNKPLSQEVVSIGSCENPDFQKQFQLLQSQTKNETLKLHNEITFTEKQKEVLRKIYQNLGENNPELKQAIENQTIKIFEVPGRDLVALSTDGKNVDYLYDLEEKEYFDFKWSRGNDLRYALYIKSINKIGLNEIKTNNNQYLLISKDTELDGFSKESLDEYGKIADFINRIVNALDYFVEQNKDK